MKKYCEKGSKRMLQLLLTNTIDTLKTELKESKLVCLSPEGDNFKEHQLNNKKVMKILGLDDGFWKGFWPTRQPQWDGILINDDKEKFDTVYLIEAKSHIHEFVSRRKLKDNASKQQTTNNELIENALKSVSDKLGIQCFDEQQWMFSYYQVANRLAFHQKLKEGLKGKEVKLIFLNFLNDPTWKNENKSVNDKQIWDDKYEKIFKKMGLNRDVLERQQGVIIINNIDASGFTSKN